MARFFTVSEAELLLERLRGEIRQAVDLKREHERCEAKLGETGRRIVTMGGVLVDHRELLIEKARKEACAAQLKQLLEAIHSRGCLVKDLDIGLVDFPTLYRGEEVYLCWKLGEPGIAYWHGVQEGFRGRKPIDEEFMASHRGDARS